MICMSENKQLGGTTFSEISAGEVFYSSRGGLHMKVRYACSATSGALKQAGLTKTVWNSAVRLTTGELTEFTGDHPVQRVREQLHWKTV
jgi:hypothetical protein